MSAQSESTTSGLEVFWNTLEEHLVRISRDLKNQLGSWTTWFLRIFLTQISHDSKEAHKSSKLFLDMGIKYTNIHAIVFIQGVTIKVLLILHKNFFQIYWGIIDKCVTHLKYTTWWFVILIHYESPFNQFSCLY